MAGQTSTHSKQTFHNWIKTGLALRYTQEGLTDAVVQEITTFHQQSYHDIINSTGLPADTTCTSCTTKRIMVCNFSNRLCKKVGSRCQTKHKPCSQGICDAFRDKIMKAHRYNEPSFKNTDARKWCKDYFEVMKCFMPSEGYANKSKVDEVDFNGIISVVIAFKPFQNKIRENLLSPINLFSKARDIGRTFRHTTTFEVTDGDFNGYLDTLSDVLSDPKYFATLQEPQNAGEKLKQLRLNSWTIVKKDIYKILEDATDAVKDNIHRIQEKTEQSLATIEEARLEVETSVAEKTDDIFESRVKKAVLKFIKDNEGMRDKNSTEDQSTAGIFGNKAKVDAKDICNNDDLVAIADQTDNDNTYRLGSKSHQLKEKNIGDYKIENLEKQPLLKGHQLEEIITIDGENVLFQRQENWKCRNDFTDQGINVYPRRVSSKQKKIVQQKLILNYREKYGKLQVSPLLKEEDAPLLDFYVTPTMKILEHHKVQSREVTVTSYDDVFFKDNKECKNIYVTGDAGIGKTAFCQRMALGWCFAHQQHTCLTTLFSCLCMANIEETDAVFSNIDLKVLKSFDFLFYISLRDTELCHIEQMILQQLDCFGNNMFLQNVLDTNKCLVILDGLDEWSHPKTQRACPPGTKVPHRQPYKNCTFITSSRTSKLDVIRLGTGEIDQQISISGIGLNESKKLVKSVMKQLNGMFNTDRSPEVLINLLKENDLLDLSKIPIVLTQLLCQWYDEGHMNLCKSIVYGRTIKMLFLRSGLLEENREAEALLSVKTVEFPRKWKSVPQLEHLAEFAYLTLFTDGTGASGLVFDYEQHENTVYPLTSDDISVLCSVGIISRNKVTANLSERKMKLQFMHRSFHEFMAAVYIAMNYQEPYTLPTEVTTFLSIVSNFLQVSYFLVFLASLCPKLLDPLNLLLLKVLNESEWLTEYRQSHFLGFMSYKTNNRFNRFRECNSNLRALQALWITCLRENERFCVSIRRNADGGNALTRKENKMYQLTDIFNDYGTDRNISDTKRFLLDNTNEPLSVSTRCYVPELSDLNSLVKFHMTGPCCQQVHHILPKYTHLKCLVLNNSGVLKQFSLQNQVELQSLHLFDVVLQHSDLFKMISFIEEQVVMKQISLVHVKCKEHGNKCYIQEQDVKSDYELDVAKHTQLVTLEISRVPIVVTGVSINELESCCIETYDAFPPNLIICLKDAIRLQYLTLDLSNCEIVTARSQLIGALLIDALPTLVFLKCLKLVSLDFGNNMLQLSHKMKDLEQIKLWWVTLTPQSLGQFISTIPQTLGVINVELLSCEVNSGDTQSQKFKPKELQNRLRSDKRFLVTKYKKQKKGHRFSLEFQLVENRNIENSDKEHNGS